MPSSKMPTIFVFDYDDVLKPEQGVGPRGELYLLAKTVRINTGLPMIILTAGAGHSSNTNPYHIRPIQSCLENGLSCVLNGYDSEVDVCVFDRTYGYNPSYPHRLIDSDGVKHLGALSRVIEKVSGKVYDMVFIDDLETHDIDSPPRLFFRTGWKNASVRYIVAVPIVSSSRYEDYLKLVRGETFDKSWVVITHTRNQRA